MRKNGANSAMDLKTFGNSDSGVDSDVLELILVVILHIGQMLEQ